MELLVGGWLRTEGTEEDDFCRMRQVFFVHPLYRAREIIVLDRQVWFRVSDPAHQIQVDQADAARACSDVS